jgi:hypothetical protein
MISLVMVTLGACLSFTNPAQRMITNKPLVLYKWEIWRDTTEYISGIFSPKPLFAFPSKIHVTFFSGAARIQWQKQL